MEQRLPAALLAETIGTFALIFIGAGAAALGLGGLVGVALAHGLVVTGFAYSYGSYSGCHINPAVTLGVWAAGAIAPARAVAYIAAQLVGGVAGGFALRFALGGVETGLGATALAQGLEAGGTSITIGPAAGLFIEAVLTFFLVNTVLHSAIAGRAGALAGVAIGGTLAFAILLGGPLTGASVNPARTLGPAVASANYADLWVYLVGPALGGLVAAALYRGPLASGEE
jgi:MIP family channel proteins